MAFAEVLIRPTTSPMIRGRSVEEFDTELEAAEEIALKDSFIVIDANGKHRVVVMANVVETKIVKLLESD